MHETRRRDASRAYTFPSYHTNTAHSHSTPPLVAMDNSRQRRYPCPCTVCRNDPRHNQTRQMINIHQCRNGTPESSAYKHIPAPRCISTEHKSISGQPGLLLVPTMATGDGEHAGSTGGDGAHHDGEPPAELDYADDFAGDPTGDCDSGVDLSDSGMSLGDPVRRTYSTTVEDCDDEDEDIKSSWDPPSDFDTDQPLHDADFASPERPSSPSSALSDHSDDDNGFEIENDDPLYARLESLYVDDPDNVDEEQPGVTTLPPAFQEHPLIRRAYVQAFIAVAFHGATHDLAQYQLECARSQLLSLSLRTGYDIPGLEKMAVTLRTAERRLGVDPDAHITYYFLCDHCWETHHPTELNDLPGHGKCVSPDCPGTLFETKRFANGKKHRVPVKVLSTASPKDVIQRLLLRPGKVAELSLWRTKPEDQAGEKPPISMDEWAGLLDDNFRMYDMTDGWGWNAIRAGLQRRKGGQWGVHDVDVNELNQRFVALPNGLVLIFNLDWYVLHCALLRLPILIAFCRFRAMKRGNYSVGAIYLTVCNNPRSKRFLREETFLLAVIPGPDEPSLEELNHILDVFIPELLELYNGKYIFD